MIKVCLVGLGKAGKEVAKVLMEQRDIKLVAAVCSPGSWKVGKDLGEIIGCAKTGIKVHSSDNLEEMMFKARPDVVVDFSNPDATMKNAVIFSKMKAGIVIATTGFSDEDLDKLYKLTQKYHNGIVYAPNITLGVNVLMLLANIASNILNNYDFQITEMHHKRKKDAPSGTALKIANEIKRGLIASGSASRDTVIPITAIRAGGVVGKHKVLIIGEEDRIEISHESFSRRIFGEGALYAVRFVYKKSGFFEMKDVLNINETLKNCLALGSEGSPAANC
ncbi:MAG TPA: 4-hydroxy-tetrahydrodipicolinate reductase [Clostridiaceae bacterium]|nr:4-hydroxy-tetrahydrodipicolinate reductase [Clostridiaceae bacterium]